MGIFGKAIGSAIGGGLGSFFGKESDAARIGGEVGSWLPFAAGGVVPGVTHGSFAEMRHEEGRKKFVAYAKGGVARPENLQGMARGGLSHASFDEMRHEEGRKKFVAYAQGGRVARILPKPYLNAMAAGGVVSEMQRGQLMTRTMPLGAGGRGRRRR